MADWYSNTSHGPNASGIYAVVNMNDGKQYVGSAVNIRRRWRKHGRHLERGVHHNEHLQRAWNRDGGGAFQWSVLELVPDRSLLVEREQAYLDRNRHGYNLCDRAGHCPDSTGIKRSPETRAKLAAIARAASPETRARIGAASRGRTCKPETRAKMRAQMVGRIFTPEWRAKISLGRRGKPSRNGQKNTPEHNARIAAALRARATHEREAVAGLSGALPYGN
jgi:group I intron endonuclease